MCDTISTGSEWVKILPALRVSLSLSRTHVERVDRTVCAKTSHQDSPHRTDSVRGTGTNADGEQVESADHSVGS